MTMKNTFQAQHVERLKKFFPIGARVKLNHMNDEYAPPVGTEGIIRFIDDAGTIHVEWDNGSTLGVIYGEDSIEVIERA